MCCFTGPNGGIMKSPAALLVVLIAVSVLLISGMAAPPEGPKVEPAQTTAADPNEVAAPAAALDDPSRIAPAVFPHDRHAEDMGIECITCHHETNAAPLTLPHKDYFDDFWIDCRICHKESGAAETAPRRCSGCHHSLTGDIADETLSAKVVIHKNCWSCHEVGTGAEASATCTNCHTSGS